MRAALLAFSLTFLVSTNAAVTNLPANATATGPKNVGIFIMPGIFISEATIPFDVYKHVAKEHNMTVFFVAETADPVTTAYGTKLLPDYTFANHPAIDVFVMPSGRGSFHTYLTEWYEGVKNTTDNFIVGKTAANAAGTKADVPYYSNSSILMKWVKDTSASAKIVTSHCWGSFTLAAAGVLDGKTVTTFPTYAKDLIAAYPQIKAIVEDQRFVVDGNVVTSNGALAAFEACLYVVMQLYGQKAHDATVAGLSYSPNNVGHAALSYYKVSPPTPVKNTSFAAAKVGILLLAGTFISEPVGPYDVYKHVENMNVYFVGESMTPIKTHYGATMYPDYTLANAPAPDIIVVPSAFGSTTTDLKKTAVIDWIKKSATNAKLVTSHSFGAFLLGAAGLLDGKSAATFPGSEYALVTQFPKVKGIAGKRIIKDGKVITSVGGVAAYEASNYAVHVLTADAYHAKKVAIGLVYAQDNYGIMSEAMVVTATSTAPTATATVTKITSTSNGNSSNANGGSSSTVGLNAFFAVFFSILAPLALKF